MLLSQFGKIALSLALLSAFLQSLLPLLGYYRKNAYALASARPLAWLQFFFVASAYVLLTIAFAKSDYSITYVAANSHVSLPLMYKLTAVWGAHEGSILLWIFILNIWTVASSMLIPNTRFLSLTLSILGTISFCFLSFLLFTSN